jgi:group I intron endonuclease
MEFVDNGFEKHTSGIYRIRNTITNKVYIGSSRDMFERRAEHRRLLRKGEHRSVKLQRSFDKHGEEAFVFEILEEVKDKLRLCDLEQVWIDWYSASVEGYNMSGRASRIELTPEVKKKLSRIRSGKPLTEEARKSLTPHWKSRIGSKSPEHSERMKLLHESGTYEGNPDKMKKLHEEHPEWGQRAAQNLIKCSKHRMSFDEQGVKNLIKDYITMSPPSASKLAEKHGGTFSGICRLFRSLKLDLPHSHYSKILIKIGFEGSSISDLLKPEIQAKLKLD